MGNPVAETTNDVDAPSQATTLLGWVTIVGGITVGITTTVRSKESPQPVAGLV